MKNFCFLSWWSMPNIGVNLLWCRMTSEHEKKLSALSLSDVFLGTVCPCKPLLFYLSALSDALSPEGAMEILAVLWNVLHKWHNAANLWLTGLFIVMRHGTICHFKGGKSSLRESITQSGFTSLIKPRIRSVSLTNRTWGNLIVSIR